MKEVVLSAWRKFSDTPFPEHPSSEALVEIRAELANISTFGSGCFHSFSQNGHLTQAHHTVLLNCLAALQRVEGKLALVGFAATEYKTEELKELLKYKEALEQFLEAVHISCHSNDASIESHLPNP